MIHRKNDLLFESVLREGMTARGNRELRERLEICVHEHHEMRHIIEIHECHIYFIHKINSMMQQQILNISHPFDVRYRETAV